MTNRLYIADAQTGSLTISDCDKFGRGNLALLTVSDVGAALRVLSGHRSQMASADGDFKLWLGAPGGDYDFEGVICGTSFGFTVSFAHVLRCALEKTAFDLVKMRDQPC